MPAVTLVKSIPSPQAGDLRKAPDFCLESATLPPAPDSPPHQGRWTLWGSNPTAMVTGKFRDEVWQISLTTWRDPQGAWHDPPQTKTWQQDPFKALGELQKIYQTEICESGPLPPFCGGLVGYFGYETALAVEELPHQGDDNSGLPDLAFMVIDNLITQDRETGQTFFIATGRGSTTALATAEAHTLLKSPPSTGLENWRAPTYQPSAGPPVGNLDGVQSQFTREEYCAAVEKCRQAILEGRVFEVCLTQQLTMDFTGDPWDLYHALRSINPAPFAAFLNFPGFAVVSASPERFLQLTPDRLAESRPIKGTAPRGSDQASDAHWKDFLVSSAKDRAENIMIVDLVRNDLGRVCEIGSVEVPELCLLESYPTVHQLVSTIRGKLAAGYDALDLVRACFPGGSMTGAPKIEAMKLIAEIEQSTRGIYSGALGFLDRRGNMDLAIVIRSIVCSRGKAWLGTGGAVTADSDPAAEYAETLTKAKALVEAVRILQVGDGHIHGRPHCPKPHLKRA